MNRQFICRLYAVAAVIKCQPGISTWDIQQVKVFDHKDLFWLAQNAHFLKSIYKQANLAVLRVVVEDGAFDDGNIIAFARLLVAFFGYRQFLQQVGNGMLFLRRLAVTIFAYADSDRNVISGIIGRYRRPGGNNLYISDMLVIE